MADITVLDRQVFTLPDAALLLRMPQATLRYWLEGGESRGTRYQPIIRAEASGSTLLTWAEFVESGWLRSYRSNKVPMRPLRSFIERLREEFGVPYPLAHHRPFIDGGRRLIVRAQEAVDLDPEFWLLTTAGRQLLYSPATDSLLRRIVWGNDIASGWRPHDDPDSPVLVDPEFKSGRPHILGISTDVIWEHESIGATPNEIAEEFSLTRRDVEWALSYEWSSRSAIAA